MYKVQVSLQVYESLHEYTLQGSAVGLAANAQHALEAIHPDLLARYSVSSFSGNRDGFCNHC